MATVIDSLIVLLKLDPSQFTAGQKKAVEDLRKTEQGAGRTARNMEQYGKQASRFFTNVRNSALELFALFAGGYGIKQFTQYTVQSVSAVGRLAYNIGLSSQELGTWEGAVRAIGGDAAAAGATMQGLSLSIQEFALTGHSAVIPFFRAMGIALADNTGKVRSMSDIYMDLSRWAQTVPPQQANFMLRAIGLDQDTINLLERGPAYLQKYQDAVRRAGTVTHEQSEAMQELQADFAFLGLSVETVGREILTDWEPTIHRVVAGTTDWIEKNHGVAKAIGEIGTALVGLMALKPAAWVLHLLGLGSVVTTGEYAAAPAAAVGGAFAGGKAVSNELTATGGSGALIAVDPMTGIPIYESNIRPKKAAAGIDVFSLFQRLENSGPGAVSKKGAIGRNQIMPGTARQYGFDPSRLGDPAYNDMVARAIEANLAARYHGDLEAMAVAYNAGPGRADRWIASGRNDAVLSAETRSYLARERAIAGPNVNIGTVVVQTNATDAAGVARDLHAELVRQANQGAQ